MAYDAYIIGSGAGGGTLARALTQQGKKVLLIERGTFLPREPANWDATQVFGGKYQTTETWHDRNGHPFTPGEYYWVGGKTKMYGAALFRLRDRDYQFWPITKEELAPYYDQAEQWYHVHSLNHVAVIQKVADVFTAHGYHPERAPVGMLDHCTRCDTCDGYPCQVGAKADAETSGVRPALETGNLTLQLNSKVTELIHDGHTITGLRIEWTENGITHEEVRHTGGAPVFLAAGAVNSAALWLKSRIPDQYELAGKNYMCHLSQAVLAVGREKIPPGFHKTLAVMDFYNGYSPTGAKGSIQMAGQPKAAMLRGESRLAHIAPNMTLREIADRSVVFWLMTEDWAYRDNQVRVSPAGQVTLDYTPGKFNEHQHDQLAAELVKLLPHMGFHLHLRKNMPLSAVAHQCGTLKMSENPQHSVVDPWGKAWGIDNLHVADASVFPASGAVNPALTVMAHALRVAAHQEGNS